MKTKTIIVMLTILCITMGVKGQSKNNVSGPYYEENITSLHLIKLNQNYNLNTIPLIRGVFDPILLEFSTQKFKTGLQTYPLAYTSHSLSYKSVSRLGGINFEQTLQTNQKVSITYKANKPDGERLEVTIDNKQYTPKLYDWQLKPIADFTNSENTAILTAFGKKIDSTQPSIIYHKAFINTLLGVRLFQADYIPVNINEYTTLPKYNGNVILGAGEQEITEHYFNEKRLMSSILNKLKNNNSWIITDNKTTITLNTSPSDNNLFGEAKPYFYFWEKGYPWNQNTVEQINAINENYLNELIKQLSLDKEITHIDFEQQKYFKESSVFKNFYHKNSTSISRLLKDYEIGQILEEYEKNNVDKIAAIPMSDLNELIEKEYYPFLKKTSPNIFKALENTMNYAALFKHIKKEKPVEWTTFINSVSNIIITPKIGTPNEPVIPE